MRRVLALPVIFLAVSGSLAGDLGSKAQREAGKTVYDKYCSQCHGFDGDGQSIATGRVNPEPRDFTSGKYKFRTTPSGTVPTDADLTRVIKDGLPYTSMPGWPQLSDTDIRNVVYYLKTFSGDFQDPEKELPPIEIPPAPKMTPESIERGREVFVLQGCAACHGELGRGDGRSGPTLKDDWGNHLRAADMTMRWTFRGGATREDIFRTFSTGLNGTPMPSYADVLAVEDRWDLVNYIYSLGEDDDPRYSNLLVVEYLEDEIDLDDGPEIFADARRSRFPLIGQIVEPGRNFVPPATSIVVQAVHNRQEIAFLLRWNDMRAETSGSNAPDLEVSVWEADQPEGSGDAGDEDDGGLWGAEVEDEGDLWGAEVVDEDEAEGDFWGEEEGDFWGDEGEEGGAEAGGISDAVALQFPKVLPSGAQKPYFLFGDTSNAVDLWFLDLAGDALRQYGATGSGAIEPTEVDEFDVRASYDNGQWTVLLKREMRSSGNVTFEMQQFVPIAFSVWDGFNRERGNKRALSAWFHLYVEPIEVPSAVGPMIRSALIVLIVEILLIWYVRRTYPRGLPDTPGQAETAGGGELTPRRGAAS